MSNEKTLYLMIGNIGAGKSSYTKKLIKETGALVVSPDSLRYMYGGGEYRFDYAYESYIWDLANYAVNSAMVKGKPVILDACLVSKKARKRWLMTAKTFDYRVCAVVLPKVSKRVSVKRRLKDNHGNGTKALWEQVWESFNNSYEEPSLREGLNQIIWVKNDWFKKPFLARLFR